ncbi:MAG: glucokinase [Verrucomicrobia bacterium]|nr:glucokinase [Verrucomicrobiota bacterium]
MILAGDIGGTSTRLGLFEIKGRRPSLVATETFSSRDAKGLDEIVRKFKAAHKLSVEVACFGIAGPVKSQRVETPNLPWHVDAAQLSLALSLPVVWLINDLEANAYGAAALKKKDFEVLNAGHADLIGNAAIISAGTGLGEAGFYFDGKRYRPFASEGGHVDFAPRNELEIEMLRFLIGKFGRVSYERVLSGPGLRNIYGFLRDTGRGAETPAVAEQMQAGDPSAAIAKAALEGKCDLCGQALDLFVAIYGAEAGNLALKLKATRGVLIGGGIAPKILPRLRGAAFMAAFMDKGRMKALLEPIPVRVILNDRTALLGAALYAALEAGLVEHALV